MTKKKELKEISNTITDFYEILQSEYEKFVEENITEGMEIGNVLTEYEKKELNDFVYNFCDSYFVNQPVDFIIDKIWVEDNNVITRVLLHENSVNYSFVFESVM